MGQAFTRSAEEEEQSRGKTEKAQGANQKRKQNQKSTWQRQKYESLWFVWFIFELSLPFGFWFSSDKLATNWRQQREERKIPQLEVSSSAVTFLFVSSSLYQSLPMFFALLSFSTLHAHPQWHFSSPKINRRTTGQVEKNGETSLITFCWELSWMLFMFLHQAIDNDCFVSTNCLSCECAISTLGKYWVGNYTRR